MEDALRQLIIEFPKNEYLTLVHTFGLFGHEKLNIKEILSLLEKEKLSKNGIRDIKSNSLKKLRTRLLNSNIQIHDLTENVELISTTERIRTSCEIKSAQKKKKIEQLFRKGNSLEEIQSKTKYKIDFIFDHLESLGLYYKSETTDEEFLEKWKTRINP